MPGICIDLDIYAGFIKIRLNYNLNHKNSVTYAINLNFEIIRLPFHIYSFIESIGKSPYRLFTLYIIIIFSLNLKICSCVITSSCVIKKIILEQTINELSNCQTSDNNSILGIDPT